MAGKTSAIANSAKKKTRRCEATRLSHSCQRRLLDHASKLAQFLIIAAVLVLALSAVSEELFVVAAVFV
ncbi:MAG: hypothetical protein KDA61_09315, partial [Planctomycetales bacterium]|nr:hypothetical protein [Planctomycetales bacterium]